MKQCISTLLILICSCLLVNTNSLTIPTPILANASVIPHTWHPTLFLAFAVSAAELQSYVDPQLIVRQPLKNGKAYILFSLSNTSVPGQPAFTDAEISTVVTYQKKVYKESLHLQFNNLLSATTCNLYVQVPYECAFAANMSQVRNDTAHTYQFNIDDGPLQLHAAITWNPDQHININNPSKNLRSSILNPSVNGRNIQSLYKFGESPNVSMPLFHSKQLNYKYVMPLHPCTINAFTSTFLETTIGNMSTLNSKPVFCAFTLERTANVTSTNEIDINRLSDP